MKRHLSLCILALFLMSCMTSVGLCDDSKNIREKFIKASGGKKVLEGIKDTTSISDMEMVQMGLSGTMTFYHKEPNMLRQDIEVMGMLITQAYDGETTWMINPQTGATEEMPEQFQELYKRQALEMGNAALLHPEKYGITYTYGGKEKSEDIDCHIIIQNFPDGHKTSLYIDAKTYLLHKIKQMTLNQMGVEVEQELFFSDYKKVDGVMAAHAMKILQDGEEFAVVTVTKISFNSGLEDSFFKMPE